MSTLHTYLKHTFEFFSTLYLLLIQLSHRTTEQRNKHIPHCNTYPSSSPVLHFSQLVTSLIPRLSVGH